MVVTWKVCAVALSAEFWNNPITWIWCSARHWKVFMYIFYSFAPRKLCEKRFSFISINSSYLEMDIWSKNHSFSNFSLTFFAVCLCDINDKREKIGHMICLWLILTFSHYVKKMYPHCWNALSRKKSVSTALLLICHNQIYRLFEIEIFRSQTAFTRHGLWSILGQRAIAIVSVRHRW